MVKEINVVTGEATMRDYTTAELAGIAATKADYDARQAAKAAMTIEQKLASIGISLADLKAELAK